MKKFRRFLAVVLAMIMAFQSSAVALAETGEDLGQLFRTSDETATPSQAGIRVTSSSEAPKKTGDPEELIYWLVTNDNTLIITASDVSGEYSYKDKGSFNRTTAVDSGRPWSYYSSSIKKVIVGTEEDEVKPVSTAYWFYQMNSVTEMELIGLDMSEVTSAYMMFYGCEKLTELDTSDWDTGSVQNMSYMFSGCRKLTELDVSGWDTGSVETMSDMFYGCSKLTELDVSNWDTGNVSNMNYMFSDCTSLLFFDLGGWDTTNASMSGMFPGRVVSITKGENTKLEVNAFSNQTDIPGSDGYWYDDNDEPYTLQEMCNADAGTYYSVKKEFFFPVKNYWCVTTDNTLVITASEETGREDIIEKGEFVFADDNQPWYEYRSSIQNVEIGKPEEKVRTTSTAYWFSRLEKVTEIDLSNLDAGSVLDMSGMFYQCGKLEQVDLPEGLQEIGDYMFGWCGSLEEIALPEAATKIGDGALWGTGIRKLSIPASVQSIGSEVASDCKYVIVPDTVTQIASNAFYSTTVVYCNSTSAAASACSSQAVFLDQIEGGKAGRNVQYSFDLDKRTLTFSGYGSMYSDYSVPYRYLVEEIKFQNYTGESLAGLSQFAFLKKLTIPSTVKSSPYFYSMEDLESVVIEEGVQTIGSFSYCENLQELVIPSTVTSIESLYGCSSLKELTFPKGLKYCGSLSGCSNLSKLVFPGSLSNINSVSDCTSLEEVVIEEGPKYISDNCFSKCTALESISIPFSVTNIADNAFDHCDNVTIKCYRGSYAEEYAKRNGIPYEYLTGSFNVEMKQNWFDGEYCSAGAITSIRFLDSYDPDSTEKYSWNVDADDKGTIKGYILADGKSVVVAAVDGARMMAPAWMSDYFRDFTKLKSIQGLALVHTDNVTSMGRLFYKCSSLKALDLSSFNTEKVMDMASMFSDCSSLESLNLTGFNTKNVTTMQNMFSRCSSLTELDVSGFDTGNVTDMQSMFNQCYSLTELDVSDFDTGNVTNMQNMFNNCYRLQALDVSGFETQNVANMQSMFYYDYSLQTLNVSGFETGNVTNMSSMFYYCSGLKTLDVSGFDTGNVTDMRSMFGYCYGLSELDTEDFDTRNVINMEHMFNNCYGLQNLDVGGFITSKVTSMQSMFYNCSGLQELDVRGFSTQKVANMASMFYNCYSLTELDVSRFSTSNVTNMQSMFGNCSSVQTLNVSGFDTGKVTNMQNMFYRCSSVQALDVSDFDTKNVTNMQYMFSGCSGVKVLDVSDFDTQRVTNMLGMFSGCSGVKVLDVSGFDTKNVTTMAEMFRGCSNVQTLDLSKFNTQRVVSMTSMFFGCSALTELDLGSFDTQRVTAMNYMFVDCSNLTDLDVSSFNTGSVTSMASMFCSCEKLTELDLGSFDTSGVADMSYMFIRCYKLAELDLSGFSVDEDCVIEYCLEGCFRLAKVKFGEDSLRLGTTLPEPSPWEITGADGYWYDEDGNRYTPAQIETAHAGTYTAVPKSFTITYVLNGGTNSSKNPSTYKASTETITLQNPTRTGYTFGGWFSDAGFKTKVTSIVKGSSGNKTFYAKWTVNKYTIKFSANGGTGSMAGIYNVTYGTSKTLTANTFKRTGYVFAGWATTATGAVKYKDKAAVQNLTATNNGTVTLYAVWTANKYTIKFNANGGSGTMSSMTGVAYGTAKILTANKFKRTGYTFAGWSTTKTGAVKYKDKASVKSLTATNNGTVTLYAKWTMTTYKITYNLDGGKNNAKNPASYNVTTADIKLQNPTKAGYTFVGWYSDSKFKTKVTVIKKGSTGNKTLYAKWKKK